MVKPLNRGDGSTVQRFNGSTVQRFNDSRCVQIWDLHCHLHGVPGTTPEARLGKLLEYADRLEIARLCVFMGMEWSYDSSAQKCLCRPGGGDPTAGFTELAVRELGAERVLYGSDAGGRSFASQLAKVLGADIPEPAKRLILGENLKRLLEPILHQKGINV